MSTQQKSIVQATFHFPRGFLWGTATSSHQVEGNNHNNNWSAWEEDPDHIIQGQKSGIACDWWNGRWKEDFDRAAEAGQNAHRLSVEWSRIQPAPDRWDEDALDRYREMLRGLYERGMTPMVTLHHSTDPLWLGELGGWENPEVVGYFEKYTRKVVEALRELNTLWVTINEPNVLVVDGWVMGAFPPGKHDLGRARKVAYNLVRAHAAAYKAIHALQPQARVGIAHHIRTFMPAKARFPPDRWIAHLYNSLFNDAFPRAASDGVLPLGLIPYHLKEARNTQDFIGLNYYTREQVAFNILYVKDLFGRHFYPRTADLSGTGFIANDPVGLFEALRWALQFKVPIIITENGVEDADDRMRPRYLVRHIHQLWRAVNFNWPVKGYFYWTLVDNFEWERGWTQRFGLWELDLETQARRKRPSADLFSEICHENGLSSEMVNKYAPEAYEQIFS
jgi:beta-glucosidase